MKTARQTHAKTALISRRRLLKRHLPGALEEKRARLQLVHIQACPCTPWACVITATISTDGVLWQQNAVMLANAPSTPRVNVRAATSMTTIRCAAASASYRKSKPAASNNKSPLSIRRDQLHLTDSFTRSLMID